MANTVSQGQPDLVNFGFREVDLEGVANQQLRNIDAMQGIVNLMLENTRTVTECQAQLLRASAASINAALEPQDERADPSAMFERQTKVYRDLVETFAAHFGQLSEIGCKYCVDVIDQVAGGAPDRKPGADRSTGKSRAPAAARNVDDRPAEE